jgi:subtilisin family serine protease
VQIINMSLGTTATFAGDCDNTTAWNMAGAAAINTLRSRGVIAFASSGNNSSGTYMNSPACLSNVISVGATNNADTVASFSNSNSSTDIMAPGVGILSSGLLNGTSTASGTSMASPHAAGCAALLIQAGEAVTPNQLEARLESSSVQVIDSTNGLQFPRIDCAPRQKIFLPIVFK